MKSTQILDTSSSLFRILGVSLSRAKLNSSYIENLPLYCLLSKERRNIEGKKKKFEMRFTIDGRKYEISRESVLGSTGGVSPKQFDGRNKSYVEIHGQQYPIKQILHLVTGLPYTGYFNAEYAHHILKKLGFKIHSLEVSNGIEPIINTSSSNVSVEGTKKFAITLRQGEDGFIIVSCPALPGCYSQGRTEEEAVVNIREAIRGYITSMRRHGEEIPGITEVREVEVAV